MSGHSYKMIECLGSSHAQRFPFQQLVPEQHGRSSPPSRSPRGEPENVLLVSLLAREAFDTLLEAKVLIER